MTVNLGGISNMILYVINEGFRSKFNCEHTNDDSNSKYDDLNPDSDSNSLIAANLKSNYHGDEDKNFVVVDLNNDEKEKTEKKSPI